MRKGYLSRFYSFLKSTSAPGFIIDAVCSRFGGSRFYSFIYMFMDENLNIYSDVYIWLIEFMCVVELFYQQ